MSKRTPPRARTEHDAWPVVVRVLVPEDGLASLYTLEDDIWDWLHRSLGRGEYFQGPHRCSFGEGVAFHFRAVEDAAAFLERFPRLVLADDTMALHYKSPDLPFGRDQEADMCNLYSHTRPQDAMRQMFLPLVVHDRAGNLAAQPEI